MNEATANVVRSIFAYYMAGASLGKVVDMLGAEHIPSPTGKQKWTRAAVDHLLSNSKYIAIVGLAQLVQKLLLDTKRITAQVILHFAFLLDEVLTK